MTKPKIRQGLFILFGIVGLMVCSLAHAQTVISTCVTLTAPGAYTAQSGAVFNMDSAATGDCIVVAAPGVELSMDSAVMNGPLPFGSSTAIHILSSATGAVINLTGSTNIGGTLATNSFNIGIEDDAADARLTIQGYIDANNNPAGGSGIGIFLNNATGTNIVITPDAQGTTDIVGASYGLWIAGGGHNTVVSGYDLLGDGGPAATFDGGLPAILIQKSNHNVINHVFAASSNEAVKLMESPGNMIYNSEFEGNPYGIRVKWDSPNNIIEKNGVYVPPVGLNGATSYDLFQGTGPSTVGCNGDYWANNYTFDGAPLTFNQPCVGALQSMTAY